jgi:hypothetical protein
MSSVTTRRSAAFLLVVTAPALAAQSAPAGVAPPPTTASTKCLIGHTALRVATGGAIGAWIGFVAAKIHYSDWNDASHTSAAARGRTTATLAGAALGMVAGALIRPSGTCTPGLPTVAEGVRLSRAPITIAEIQKSGLNGNVYDLIYSLRRNWLNLRGVDALTEGYETLRIDGQDVTLAGKPRLAVYLDNAHLDSVDELRTLPVAGITGVRYYDAAEATVRWGTGNSHGAIQVLTTPQ